MNAGSKLQERVARMGPAARGLSILVVIVLALFVAGFWVGFVTAAIEHGHILPRKPLGWAMVVAAILATVTLVQLLRALLKGGGMFAGMTGFDRRYWKMWMWLGLLGVPLGIALVLLGEIDVRSENLGNLFSAAPIPPGVAAAITAALLLMSAAAVWLYHRTIDDHEERAYLWGSQIAYYFVAAAIPCWWLLSRGGIVRPVDFAVAIIIILVSFLVQAAVWAWLKFR